MPRPLPETPPEALADRLEHAEDVEAAPTRRRWRRWALWVGIPLVVFGVGAVVSVMLLRNRTTVIPVEDTVTKFRDVGTADEVTGLPAPGVYVYTTEGTEHVNALGGGTHHYPAETTLTVTVAGDCVTNRWDALKERWDQYAYCLDGKSLHARNFAIYHNFFLKSDYRDYVCSGDSVFLPADRTAGATWSARCVAGDATSTNHGRILGIDPIEIGGERVDALHLRLDTDLGGSTEGARHAEAWLDPETALTLRLVVDVATDADSALGRVHYTEHYEATLGSLTPRT